MICAAGAVAAAAAYTTTDRLTSYIASFQWGKNEKNEQWQQRIVSPAGDSSSAKARTRVSIAMATMSLGTVSKCNQLFIFCVLSVKL
jgi:hypothetical protein